MARRVIFGVENTARKVRKMYLSVSNKDSMYELQRGETVNITSSNIDQHFTRTNGTYYFVGNGNTFITNNKGIKSTTASTVLTALKDIEVSFAYSYSSESRYDKFYLTIADEAIENGVSGTTTTASWSGIIKAGQTISFKYTKDSSTDNNDDQCTFSNMKIAEVRQVLVEDFELKHIARKIHKGYIGDGNNVAQLFYVSAVRMKYKTTGALGYQRVEMTAAPLEQYAVFAGGMDTTGLDKYSEVFAYDTAMVRTKPTVLSSARSGMFGARAGDSVLFGGGQTSSSMTNTVDTYNADLTKGTTTGLRASRFCGASVTIGNTALFAGGANDSTSSNIVDAYNESLTRITTVQSLSIARHAIGAAVIGNYALFAGGCDYEHGEFSDVDVYDSSLTKLSNLYLPIVVYDMKGATTGKQAVFAGGNSIYDSSNGGEYPTVAFDESLTQMYEYTHWQALVGHAAVSVENNALFAGGTSFNGNGTGISNAFAYDDSLTAYEPGALNTARQLLAGCAVGSLAYFVGGQISSNQSSQHIDIYEPV